MPNGVGFADPKCPVGRPLDQVLPLPGSGKTQGLRQRLSHSEQAEHADRFSGGDPLSSRAATVKAVSQLPDWRYHPGYRQSRGRRVRFAFRSFLVRLLSIAGLMTLATLSAADSPPGEDGLTAADIIMRMQQAYARSRSYLDKGTVKEVFIDAAGKRVVEKPFATAFVRPDRFRYEFRERSPYLAQRRFVIHRNGNELRTHWDVEHDLELDTLDRAIAAATGVSSESAITVPGMLMPGEITWRRAIRFRTPTRLEDEMLGDIDCYRIVGSVAGGLITFWIGKHDLLLRKTYLERWFGDFRVERTTTYRPAMDTEIESNLLEFD